MASKPTASPEPAANRFAPERKRAVRYPPMDLSARSPPSLYHDRHRPRHRHDLRAHDHVARSLHRDRHHLRRHPLRVPRPGRRRPLRRRPGDRPRLRRSPPSWAPASSSSSSTGIASRTTSPPSSPTSPRAASPSTEASSGACWEGVIYGAIPPLAHRHLPGCRRPRHDPRAGPRPGRRPHQRRAPRHRQRPPLGVRLRPPEHARRARASPCTPPRAATSSLGDFVILAVLLFVARRVIKVPGWTFCTYMPSCTRSCASASPSSASTSRRSTASPSPRSWRPSSSASPSSSRG